MEAHGWHSAEVIATAAQIPRAGMIFNHFPLEWRTHTAPLLQPLSGAFAAGITGLETLKTLRYLVYANWAERCEP
jgi:hypothetical protein